MPEARSTALIEPQMSVVQQGSVEPGKALLATTPVSSGKKHRTVIQQHRRGVLDGNGLNVPLLGL
jgi:hypothetical protein